MRLSRDVAVAGDEDIPPVPRRVAAGGTEAKPSEQFEVATGTVQQQVDLHQQEGQGADQASGEGVTRPQAVLRILF